MRTPDLGRSFQHKAAVHPGRGAGVDLVEQRRAEEVGAGNGATNRLLAASNAPWSLYSVLLMVIFVQLVSGT
jgi:hypothetical protein